MVNAQEYINNKYPDKTIKNLDLTNKNLEGELDLSDFKNLEELDCGDNELKTLKLNGCLELKNLWCYNNKLTELEINDLTKLVHLDCRDNYLPDLKLPSSTGLTYLTIRNNNLSKRNLSMFSHLTNLEILYIGSDEHDQDKVDKGIYNKFEGSLKYLKNLENLTELSISSTDIDSGIEYLPKSIKKFYCSADLRKEAEVEKIKQALKGKLPAEIEEDTEELFERSKEIQKDIHQFFEGYSDEEIKQLKDPKQIENYEKWIWWTRNVGRLSSLIGSVLTFTGYHPTIGGVITVSYPLVDFVLSTWEENYVKSNESKWEEFVKSSKELWGDYRDLMEGLNSFKVWDDFPLEQWKNIKKLKEKEKNAKLNNEEKQELTKSETQLIEKIGRKSYQLLPLWEELQDIYYKDDLKRGNLMTKSEFAQDLWKHWEYKDRKEIGWGNDGRKFQWNEIKEMLVEISNKTNQVQGTGTKSMDSKLEGLKEVVIDIKENQQAFQVQPTYGTFSSSSKK